MKVILERFPYRFTENGLLETNGEPDYRIQKWNEGTDRYRDMFYLDSAIQMDMAMAVSYTHLTLPTKRIV